MKGHAAPLPEEEEEVIDNSVLNGMVLNKAGNVVDDNGKLFGKVVTGEVAKLVGKKCDAEGKIWSESGKVIGKLILTLQSRSSRPICNLQWINANFCFL